MTPVIVSSDSDSATTPSRAKTPLAKLCNQHALGPRARQQQSASDNDVMAGESSDDSMSISSIHSMFSYIYHAGLS